MDDASAREVRIIRTSMRMALGVVLVALLIYPADWVLWRLRVARGGGMDTVPVTRFTVAELKGNKEEYYPEGTTAVDCSRSLFPQGSHLPCCGCGDTPR